MLHAILVGLVFSYYFPFVVFAWAAGTFVQRVSRWKR